MDEFTHEAKDKHGFAAPEHMVGFQYQRISTHRVFTITGVVYLDDEWGLTHVRRGSSVTFCRPLKEFMNGDSCKFVEFK